MLGARSWVTICFPEKQQLLAVDMLDVLHRGQHFQMFANVLEHI